MSSPNPHHLEMAIAPRSAADMHTLLGEIRHSPFIGEITLGDVRDLIEAQTIRLFYDGDVLVGFAAWMTINAQWIEAGPFYIARAYRGQGIGHMMVDTLVKLNIDAGRNIYGVTKNPQVKKMFERRGFHRVNPLHLPPAIVWHLIRKLSLRKLLRYLQKFSPSDPVAHYVRTNDERTE